MNEKLLQYYQKELSYLRNEGLFFAQENPKIASRLGMNSIDVPDPYIERLLEGIAFLNARTNLKIDASYPNFVTNILEVVYPQLLNPTPSSAIVNLELSDNYHLNTIHTIKRGDTLNSLPMNFNDQKVNCTFSFTQNLELSPLKLEAVSYSEMSVAKLDHIAHQNNSSVLKLDFSIEAPHLCSDLIPEQLKVFLGHDIVTASQLLHLLITRCSKVVCHNYDNTQQWSYTIHHKPRHLGFSDDDSLSINSEKTIDSLRIIQEYIQLPEKFLFIEQKGLKEAIIYAEKNNYIDSSAMQIQKIINDNGTNKKVIGYQKRRFSLSFIFDQISTELINSSITNNISISALPIVNVFKKRGVRLAIDANHREHHIVIDKTQPLNFEVYSIDKINAYNKNNQKIDSYTPFYRHHNQDYHEYKKTAYFSLNRERRLAHDKVYRTSYLGHEVFVNLSNIVSNTSHDDIHQISLDAWCTNRDLPILMPLGVESDFLIEEKLPVKSIKLIKRLTRPKEAIDNQNHLWSILNLVRLNYASLINISNKEGVEHIKEVLSSFPHDNNDLLAQNINAIVGLNIQTSKKILRDGLHSGVVRGLKVRLEIDEGLMGGVHPFLFGSILRSYLSCIISINSFLDFSLEMTRSKDVLTWSDNFGSKFVL